MKEIIRKLTQNSKYSYAITVPKEIIEKYGWKSRQKIVVKDKGRGILEIKGLVRN